MAGLTDLYERKILDGLLGVTPLVLSTEPFLALYTQDPTDAGSASTEMSGSGYNRVSLAGVFAPASGTDGTSKNTGAVVFDAATADWSTITHIGITAGGSNGMTDLMIYGKLLTSVDVGDTENAIFGVADLTLTLS